MDEVVLVDGFALSRSVKYDGNGLLPHVGKSYLLWVLFVFQIQVVPALFPRLDFNVFLLDVGAATNNSHCR